VAIAVSRARLPLGIVLAILLVCLPAVSLSFAADKKDVKVQTLRQTGRQLLDVGYEQYRRGMYDNARETLGKAAAYREYLSVSDASKLDTLLEKLGSQPAPDANQVSGQPVEKPVVVPQAEPVIIEQPVALQQPEPNVVEQPMTMQQTEPVIVEKPVQAQPQAQQPAASPEYIEFVPIEANDINRPAQSPMPVIQTQVRPEFITPAPQEPNIQIEVYQPQQSQAPIAPAGEKAKEDYIEVVKQKQRIQQSYTKAVVNEAVAKAKEYADKEDFLKAKDEISRASAVIEKNKLLLGDTDYAQYSASLQQLLDEINTRQTEIERLKAEKVKAEAQTAQERLRAQQTADRQKRIQDLLTHSMEYQEQQRYEEALAQLDTLLAIDPTHREATRNKQMLEDIINLRRQLEVKKEMGKEEEAILTDTQKSMIPHADLVTYPRNWQDIAKRVPKTISGLAPADAAVYKQLETVVDLTALTPDTPLGEAMETIKTSVDPPLKIVVRWKDLADNAYIEQDTVIGMQGLAGIPLGKALKELLDTVGGAVTPIDFSVDEGVITIATRGSLPAKLVTHVYEITELIGAPANYRTGLQTTTAEGAGATEVTETSGVVAQNAATIVQMIQETIAPMSWLINGGEGTISIHGTRLVISQTPQIHEQIQKLLMEDLRESLGQQVSIETRFLFVTENFLENIGLGINSLNIKGAVITGNDKLTDLLFDVRSYEAATPAKTLVPGSLADQIASPAIQLAGGLRYGSLLDDLSVSFFLRATQAHRDAKMLTAPRVTVLSGESAYIRVTKEIAYVSDYEFEDITAAGQGQPVRVIANPTTETIAGGVILNVTPTITADKKYVILQISTNYTKTDLSEFPVYSTTGQPYNIQLPTLEVSEVQTRVSVPDGGTLLIGGQKLGAEANREAGVPGVSKVPFIGRLFSHRSKVKDQDILLILVKPSIILQEEAEREYFAPLE
jgi:Flp pilus assembly secretin CpaC/tetratricopeptide (TPR) repeat protein